MAAPVRSSEAITASACRTDTYSLLPQVTQCSSISTTSSELERFSVPIEARFLFVGMQTINSLLHQEDLNQWYARQGATPCKRSDAIVLSVTREPHISSLPLASRYFKRSDAINRSLSVGLSPLLPSHCSPATRTPSCAWTPAILSPVLKGLTR